MKKTLTAISMLLSATTISLADTAVIRPTVVTKIQKGDYADKEFYDPEATSWTTNYSAITDGMFIDQLANYGGSYVVLNKYYIGNMPKDITVTKATISFNSICTVSGKNSQLALAQINSGIDLTIASWNSINTADLKAEKLGNLIYSSSTGIVNQVYDATQLITEALKSGEENLAFAVFTNTGREQRVSDFKITIEYSAGKLSTYTYTLNALDNDSNLIKVLEKGEEFEGIEKKLYFPHMIITEDGRKYFTPQTNYEVVTVDTTQQNILYSAYERDLRVYKEVEEITPMCAGDRNRFSSGDYGYVENVKVYELTTLPSGKYTCYAYLVDRGDRGIYLRDFNNTDNETNTIAFPDINVQSPAGMYNFSFELTKETTIGLSGKNAADAKTNQSAGIDYIYIVRTGDYVAPVFPKDVSDKIPAEWICEQGDGPTDYEGASDVYTTSAYNAGKVIYQRIEGLQPGKYKVDFYATANMMFFGAAYGAKIAQVYCNDKVQNISVINQTGCVPTEYSRSFTVTTTDGVIEYGIQNIAIGGNWYVCKSSRITQLDSLSTKDLMESRLRLARGLVKTPMNGSILQTLSEIVAEAEGYAEMSKDSAYIMLAKLNGEIAVAEKSEADYSNTIMAYNNYLKLSKGLDEAGQVYYQEAVADIKEAYDNRVMESDMSSEILAAYIAAQNAQDVREPIETIGTDDFSSVYDAARSTLMTVENGQTLHYEFENFTPETVNYYSWMLIVKSSMVSTNYNIILRNDSWDNASRSNAGCLNNFNWATFVNDMNGARVDMDITYLYGKVTMEATITTKGGKTYNYTFSKNGFTQNVLFMYLTNVCSYQNIYKAYITGDPVTGIIAADDKKADDRRDGKFVVNGNIMVKRADGAYGIDGKKW